MPAPRTVRPRPSEREARLFAAYLINRPITRRLTRRYARACLLLLPAESFPPRDHALVAFAVRRPWAIPCLDAGCGVFRRDHLLRRKILITAAILEATKEHTGAFLPERHASPFLLPRVLFHGIRAMALMMIGTILYPIASRVR